MEMVGNRKLEERKVRFWTEKNARISSICIMRFTVWKSLSSNKRFLDKHIRRGNTAAVRSCICTIHDIYSCKYRLNKKQICNDYNKLYIASYDILPCAVDFLNNWTKNPRINLMYGIMVAKKSTLCTFHELHAASMWFKMGTKNRISNIQHFHYFLLPNLSAEKLEWYKLLRGNIRILFTRIWQSDYMGEREKENKRAYIFESKFFYFWGNT